MFGDGGPRATNHRARAVFVGKVLGVERATPEQIENGLGVAVARLRVKRFWKGVKTTEINVSTEIGLICGPRLEGGQEYLVYAFGKPFNPVCTRPRKLGFAEEDLQAPGPPKFLKQN